MALSSFDHGHWAGSLAQVWPPVARLLCLPPGSGVRDPEENLQSMEVANMVPWPQATRSCTVRKPWTLPDKFRSRGFWKRGEENKHVSI